MAFSTLPPKWRGALIAGLALALAAPGAAAQDRADEAQGDSPGMTGRLGVLPSGYYQCALPGDAGGPAWYRVPERDFTVRGASSYRAQGRTGTYLLRGKWLLFTRGPFKGVRLERTGSKVLRQRNVDRGANGFADLRCVRTIRPRGE